MKMKIIFGIVISLFCVNAQAQEKASNSRSVEYLERRSISYTIGDREFEIEFTDEDIIRTPSWDIEKQPAPLSTAKAIEIGRDFLGKYAQTPADWRLEKIHYDKVGNDRWVCILAFRSPLDEKNNRDVCTVVIKLDGKVIEPKVTLVQKSVK